MTINAAERTIETRSRLRLSSSHPFAEHFAFSRSQVPLLLTFTALLAVVVAASAGTIPLFIAGGVIVGLGIAALAFSRPVTTLLLVCLAAGLPSLLIPLPGHTMRPIEIALFLCVGVILIRRPSMRLRIPHLFALLFFAIAILSFIHVPVIGNLNSYGADKRLYAVLLLLLALFAGSFLVNYVKDISAFLATALLCNIPLLLIGLGQALKWNLPSILVPSRAIEVIQEGRLSGPSDSPTTFAYYLINLFAVALACWLLGTHKRERIIGFIIMVTSALEIVETGTRSATGAALVLLVVALITRRRYKALLGFLGMLVIAGSIFISAMLPKFLHGAASTSNRLFLWQYASKIILAHPWIGIGLGQFPSYYARLIISQSTQLNPSGISVHDQYIEWALESGIFWFIVGLALLLSVIFCCWKAYTTLRAQRVVFFAVILMIVANLIICFVDVPFDQTEASVWLFLIAGLALGYTLHGQQEQRNTPRNRDVKQSFMKDASLQNTLPYPSHSILTSTEKLMEPFTSPYMKAIKATTKHISATQGYHSSLVRLQSYTSPAELTAPLPVITREKFNIDVVATPNVQKAGRSVIIQLLSWVIAIPIIFPTTAMLTHYLGPVQYGEYNFTLSILAVCALLSMTGMDPIINRYLNRQKRGSWEETLSYAAGTRFLNGLIVSGGAAIITCLIPMQSDQRNLLLLGYGTLLFSYSFNCLRSVFEVGFIAEQHVSSIALLTTINRIMTAGLITLAVVLRLSLIWTYALIAYSDLPIFIFLVILAKRHYAIRLRFSWGQMRRIIKESLALTANDALSLLVGQLDLLLLLPLAGISSVGIYALALRLTSPFLNIVYSYVSGLFPYLCTQFEKGFRAFAELYYEATRILALGIIPLTLFVIVTAPQIVALIAGDRFLAAIGPTQLSMCCLALAFFTQLTTWTSMAANKERFIPYITGITLIVNALANILLIPHLQASGAAIAGIVSEFVSVCLFSLLIRKHVQLPRILLILTRILIGNIPGVAFLIWQQQQSLFLLAPFFCILTLIGYVITGVLSLKDISMARQIIKIRKAGA